MFRRFADVINRDLKKTNRAIVSLGCSFVEGQGAVNDELYTDYSWVYETLGVPLQLQATDQEKQDILSKYPNVGKGPDGKLDFTFMEIENSFVSKLCKKYFNETYTPINLGMRGKGNRGTIKELSMHPELNWNDAKEIIVVYCPSGMERFDFFADQCFEHGGRYECMWPNYQDKDGPKRLLWEGYSKLMWSDKFGVLEQIGHMQELKMWCKIHNAQLIITPSFDRRYNRKSFIQHLSSTVRRDADMNLVEIVSSGFLSGLTYDTSSVDLWPWESMFRPEGDETFIDLLIKKEEPKDFSYKTIMDYFGNAGPNGWITSCAHPSAKGHDYFAKLLYEHINKNIL